MFSHRRSPDFERLRRTLSLRPADVIPLIELGIHPTIKEAILGRPIATVLDDAAFMRCMGYDFVKIQPTITFELQQHKSSVGRYPGDMNAPDISWAPEKNGMIQSWEDFHAYPWPTARDIDYSRFEEARNRLPEGMGIIGQYGDIFTVAWEMMGFESYAVAMYEQPDLVRAVFEKVAELILSMFKTMASMDWVGALWFSDDIAYSTGLMVSPDYLREHFFPCIKEIGSLAKSRGIPLLYHTDGLLWEVMEDIIASGVTALHPIEPKAMDIGEVKKKYGDRLCLCGGLDVDLLARGTPEDVVALVDRFVAKAAPGGGWCAGSSNSIPAYVPVRNYVTMVEALLSRGAGG